MSQLTRKKLTSMNGFTLIELLVVIGILAILLAITLIAINPNKHFQDSRNTQRSSNVSEVLNAIYEYEAAHSGNRPPSVAAVSTTAATLSKGADVATTGVAFAAGAVTFTVSGNTITTAGTSVTVTGCDLTADNGVYPVVSGNATTLVVTNANGVAGATGCVVNAGVDLCSDLVPADIADLPTDPSSGVVNGGSTPCDTGTTDYDTGYTITQTSGRFTIAAPGAEGTAVISVTR